MIRNIVLAALCAVSASGFAQATGGRGVPGPGGGVNCGGVPGGSSTTGCGGVPGGSSSGPVISGLSYSQSDTSIVASWSTSLPASSALTCGGKAGIDNGVQQNVTTHQAIVTGLVANTLYSCLVTSGTTSSSPQNVTTNVAQTRTAITNAASGTPTTTLCHGDTLPNVVSNDNKTYMLEDDGYGFVNSGSCTANAGANMQVGVLTNEATLVGTTVNLLTNYGGFNTTNGTDGPGGVALSNKISGLFGMGGALYAYQNRDWYGAAGHTTQQVFSGNVMESLDHGATWNSWQTPGTFQANGVPPSPLGSFQFATAAYAWCEPVRYAIDDGTNGYLTAGNRIDGADGWVYTVCTDGMWNNSSNLYMLRMTRASLLQSGTPQYWHGPTSPAPTDFVNDTNWTTSATGATAIYTAANQTSAPDLIFIPSMNYYLLMEWYQPSPTVTSNSVWVMSAGPTPAGPWTQVGTQTNNPSGWYNPVVMHRTAATNATSASATLTIAYSGDYGAGSGTYYYPTYSTLYLNNAPLLDAIGAATAPIFAGSCSHLLRSAYVGNGCLIQRASDSTTQAVGFNSDGTINQTTITTFCSGTTCNVKTLYDQSGNGHDATQATFANMPVIYTGGAVVHNGVNSRVAMLWDGTQRYLASSITFSAGSNGQNEAFLVGNVNSSAIQFSGALELTDGTHSGGSQAGLINLLDYYLTSPTDMGTGASGITAAVGTITQGTQFLADAYAQPGITTSLAINGGAFANGTGGISGTFNATVLDIGTDLPSSTYFWYGNISDVVLYSNNSAALSANRRLAAHSVESSFFGTP